MECSWGAARTLQTGNTSLDFLEVFSSVTKHRVVSTYKFQGIQGIKELRRGTSLTLAQRGEVHLISTELLEIASSLQTVFLLGAQRSWSQGLAELALGLISTGGHCVNATHLAGPCWDLSRTLHVLCPGSLSNLKWNCTERKTPWRHLRHDKMTVLYKKWQPLRWK